MSITTETRNKTLELIAAKLGVSIGQVEAEINKDAVDDAVQVEINAVTIYIRQEKAKEANQYKPTGAELRAALEAKKPEPEP